MHIHIHAFMYIYMHMQMHVCMNAHLHRYICMYIYTYLDIQNRSMRARIYICTGVCIYMDIHPYICICKRIYICVHIHMHACVCLQEVTDIGCISRLIQQQSWEHVPADCRTSVRASEMQTLQRPDDPSASIVRYKVPDPACLRPLQPRVPEPCAADL